MEEKKDLGVADKNPPLPSAVAGRSVAEDGNQGLQAANAPAHSPLPWVLEHRAVYAVNEHGATRFRAAILQGWADGHVQRITEEECHATAAFIHRACNSHYELLEALRRLLKAPGYNQATENYSASQHARMVIAKAERK